MHELAELDCGVSKNKLLWRVKQSLYARGEVCEQVWEKMWGLILTRQINFSVLPPSNGSAGSALVCLCTELPIMLFLKAERRNNTLVLPMWTAIHIPTHNMSIKRRPPFPLHTFAALQVNLRSAQVKIALKSFRRHVFGLALDQNRIKK